MTTEYHSQYYAYQLTKRLSSDNAEKLSQSLFNATVDLNPHQIEAALFAFRSPLSRGALLADEVGLGKTIEAGLVMSQLWAERKRHILCIVPASLRKQWNRELVEKFFIGSVILETKSYNAYKKQHGGNPFDQPGTVIICSYQFARSRADELRNVAWDLVCIDEAHRVRNVYKKSNKIASAIREAIHPYPKLLLTATPLQNTLMELYGLITFIDPQMFGSVESFRAQFATKPADVTSSQLMDLRQRIRPICQRTLRRQVTEYVPYTNRMSITQDFTPTDEEVRLYNNVSSYLQKPELVALPSSQRQLITLILRKILASSSFAIAATLGKLIARLEMLRAGANKGTTEEATDCVDDLEHTDELQDEWAEVDSEGTDHDDDGEGDALAKLLQAIESEISELREYKQLAESITTNAKGDALLIALKRGFEKAKELRSPRKALIFTESRRTQSYLRELLEDNGYAGELVTFNGTNADPDSRQVYQDWLKRHQGEDCITGSPTADMRSALVDYFQEQATVMIATESAAEGVNLQFCNLVVNFDLPWNPQRIEQRIGRCHRYGQKHDVVVINFLNRKNAADQRVFQLLADKFRLFDGVFGSSDEVLGTLESGVDFEKRISEIYQQCRTPEEINTAFDALQQELDEQIQARMADARTKLMEHFDEDVHERLRMRSDETRHQIDRFGHWLWAVTRYELVNHAHFDDGQLTFQLHSRPTGAKPEEVPLGRYRIVTQRAETTDHHFRFGHPLVTVLLEQAKHRKLTPSSVAFDYTGYPGKVSLVERLLGRSGWLQVTLLSITALETEEHLIVSGMTDAEESLDHEICEKMLAIPGAVIEPVSVPDPVANRLDAEYAAGRDSLLDDARSRNEKYFEQEMDKLDRWADDLKIGIDREIKDLEIEIRSAKKDARQAATLELKLEGQRCVKDLEKKLRTKRRGRDEAYDEIEDRKDQLIDEIEARLKQTIDATELFTIRWRVQ